jgi:predicted CXXCH cytochrome family protein
MINRILLFLRSRRLKRVRLLAVSAGILVLLVAVISCRTDNRTAVLLPNVPGAKYVGSQECEMCHPNIYQNFQTATHARLIAKGPNAIDAGCESCHGPASLHVDSGGDILPPYSFTAGRPQSTSYGGRQAQLPERSVATVCYRCHADVRGQFDLPSHHPVPEGRMSCTDCHSPHKGSIFTAGGTSLISANDGCLRCHSAQRGPYVFEHEALREGCTTCHTPHGTINAKMLKVRDSNLCLKCHFQRISNGRILIGGSDHTLRLQQGTCWTAGCHEAVHGSRVNSSLRF